MHYAFFSEALAAAHQRENLWFDVQRFMGPDALKIFVDTVGAHRLVYGSNTPFDAIHSSLLLVEKAAISEEDRQKIFSSNLAGLLGV